MEVIKEMSTINVFRPSVYEHFTFSFGFLMILIFLVVLKQQLVCNQMEKHLHCFSEDNNFASVLYPNHIRKYNN